MYDLVVRAEDNDNDAMLELIGRFRPLMLKYAKKLNYDDAYEDMVFEFIRLIKTGAMDNLNDRQDKTVISYIKECMVNFYKKKVQSVIKLHKEIALSDLTEEQLYYVRTQLSQTDEENILTEFGMDQLLNTKEEEVLYLVYVKGYSAAEIAREWNRSRQAVNQLKKRALQKVINKTGRAET